MQAFCKGLIVLASSTPFGMALLASPKQDPDEPVTYLSQGWSRGTSERFHYAPQGSELVPYYWFLNLTEPDGTTLLKDNLKQFGVLYDNPSPGISHHNPDGLPIGFARQDESQTLGGITEKHWLGLTCAACHTGVLVPKPGSKPVRQGPIIIDGAPAKFDVAAFLTRLQASVQATDSDPLRLHTLAEKAFAAGDGNSVEEIETRFHNYTRQLNEILPLYLPTVPSGPGRLDCFGAIINRVCVFDIKSPQPPPAKLNAPVDFPFIWYTDRQSQIQWFGELPNSNWFDRLARNAGEVSGVFAQVVVKPKASWAGYPSSLNALGLGWIDQSVSSLTAPKWNDVFPAPDPAAVKRGERLFKPTCQAGGCHRALAPKNHVFDVAPTPLVEDPAKKRGLPNLATDPNNTEMIHTTLSQTGILQQTPTGGKIVSPSPATSLVGDIVVGELIGAKKDVFEAYVEYLVDKFFHVTMDKATAGQKIAARGKMKADITKKVMAAYKLTKRDKPTTPVSALPFDPKKAGYESRSMNGIWATAPYLHNGSVPNLVQLLWPEKRGSVFYIGSEVYDPNLVGYVSNGSAGGKLFNTKDPGNSNEGHIYGANLTNAQKYDLIAYLKTL